MANHEFWCNRVTGRRFPWDGCDCGSSESQAQIVRSTFAVVGKEPTVTKEAPSLPPPLVAQVALRDARIAELEAELAATKAEVAKERKRGDDNFEALVAANHRLTDVTMDLKSVEAEMARLREPAKRPTCSKCEGDGRFDGAECNCCDGTGKEPAPFELELRDVTKELDTALRERDEARAAAERLFTLLDRARVKLPIGTSVYVDVCAALRDTAPKESE